LSTNTCLHDNGYRLFSIEELFENHIPLWYLTSNIKLTSHLFEGFFLF